MAHLDLVWPGVILVACFAGAVLVRTIATHADRVAREKSRKWLRDVWQERRGGAETPPTSLPTSAPKSERESSG